MKTPTASSRSGSFVPPTMTSVICSQGFLEAFGEALRHAERHYVLDRRFPDRLHRAEVSQERSFARGSDSFDRIQRRRECFSRADLAVMCDRESVCLVAYALNEEHPW